MTGLTIATATDRQLLAHLALLAGEAEAVSDELKRRRNDRDEVVEPAPVLRLVGGAS